MQERKSNISLAFKYLSFCRNESGGSGTWVLARAPSLRGGSWTLTERLHSASSGAEVAGGPPDGHSARQAPRLRPARRGLTLLSFFRRNVQSGELPHDC